MTACTSTSNLRPPTAVAAEGPSAAEAEAAFAEFIPELLRLDIRGALDAYLSITSAIAPGRPCPPYLETFEGEGYRTRYFGYYLEDGRCTLDNGGSIDGYGEEYLYWDDGYFFDEVLLEGTLTSVEGFQLFGYGYLDDLHRVTPTFERRYRGLVGDLTWSGPLTWSGGDMSDSWLARGYGGYLDQSWQRSADGVQLLVNGGLDRLEGPITAISVQDLKVRSAPAGCRAEPHGGAMAALGADGTWVHLDWGEACDGCATAWRGDTDLGEVCLDLDALMLELPW